MWPLAHVHASLDVHRSATLAMLPRAPTTMPESRDSTLSWATRLWESCPSPASEISVFKRPFDRVRQCRIATSVSDGCRSEKEIFLWEFAVADGASVETPRLSKEEEDICLDVENTTPCSHGIQQGRQDRSQFQLEDGGST
ncbi:hypothetical protein N7539_005175 [Penicillium diatomitis]|uniref:Uncharacterized protein n=1 Tax=Penicillium diatomitis TaxID=2819901 RepID=A0A9W9X6H0_9EURO|nr:uncharacterized protein N7539_005175 [Penicillium diatomitis]KAJ5485187.1 hypothetical protein N7539_005175 [Penicillium diatomitis]